MISLLPTLLILLGSSKATPSPGPTPTPTPASVTDEKGFPEPDLTGYEHLPYPKSGVLQGRETFVDTWENARGDQIRRLSLHGVVYAWGVFPGGDPTRGYLLFDPKCEKKLTVKYAPDAAFDAPLCAQSKKPR